MYISNIILYSLAAYGLQRVVALPLNPHFDSTKQYDLDDCPKWTAGRSLGSRAFRLPTPKPKPGSPTRPNTGSPRSSLQNTRPNDHPDDTPSGPLHVGSEVSQSHIDRVFTFDKYISDGRRIEESREFAVRNNIPDKTTRAKNDPNGRGDYADIEDGYNVGPEFGKANQYNKDIQGNYEGVTVKSKDRVPNSKHQPDIVQQNMYNPEDGVAIVSWAFQGADGNPTSSRNRLPYSEIFSQTWARISARRHGRPESLYGNLQLIVGRDVQNKGAVKVLEDSYRMNDIPNNEIEIFTPNPNNKAMDDAFTAWLGTDTVKSKIHFLKDHHNQFGNKRITKIMTFPKDYVGPQAEGRQFKLTVVMFVGQ
ncbi:hypothetical protein M501DRAFT_989520 [Patellaria atrata CBS 101060]|uniref:Uncharacterized protein n=1 Tax=Patellaria atrata CBS 101060 TaxID=1346257 RepID=A0A9P4VNS1_9PEZI|nr:hypothetical protein M501DRAFT_989520 [Patellaria atrata CBS 101060]